MQRPGHTGRKALAQKKNSTSRIPASVSVAQCAEKASVRVARARIPTPLQCAENRKERKPIEREREGEEKGRVQERERERERWR